MTYNVKNKWKILSNSVTFSQYMNFNGETIYILCLQFQFLCKTQNPTSECPLWYNQTNGNKNPIPCRERCHSHLAPLPSTPNSVIWIIQIQYCLTNTYFSESHWMGPSVGKLGMCLETMSPLLLHKLNAVKENWLVTFYCVTWVA